MEKKLSKSQEFEQRNKEVNRSKKKRTLDNLHVLTVIIRNLRIREQIKRHYERSN